MAFINNETKEIHCKIVYYGPSLGGKTTNVQWIYTQVSGEDRSKMVEFIANPERTKFFDFYPMDAGQVRGLKTRLHLFSVPGQTVLDATRRLVLKGIDGLVFVADSQLERMDENIESMKNLVKNLELHGHDIQDIPMVIQYNKRDLPNVAPLAELRTALNKYNAPDFEAVASTGRGVKESLKTISRTIITTLKGGEL
jgi:mutual gliding-motility protein MglA